MAGREAPVKVRLTALDELSKVFDRVKAKFPEMTRGVNRTNAAFKVFQKTTEGFSKGADRIGKNFQKAGTIMSAAVTLPALAAAGFSVKAFADYETALVGVGKTTNLAGAELEAMGQRFIDMSTRIPVPVEELLQLGQTAAQLGVRGTADILKFSEVMAKLSRASNIKGEEGASDLARFITVTKSSIGDVDRFASSLVALGNTSAATENEILGFALRLAGSTAVFNVTGQQALAYATTLRSVGIEAEAGSSSIQRALGGINEAIGKGGVKLQALSQLTGIAAADLAGAFKKDASGTLLKFASGLNQVEKAGGDVTKALDFFGLSGVRDLQTLGALSQNTDLLATKMKTVADAFRENTALEQEYAAASKTMASGFQVFQNKLFAVGVVLGGVLAPALSWFFGILGKGLDYLRANPALLLTVAAFVAMLAVIGPLLLAFGTFLTFLPAMVAGFGLLTAGSVGFGAALWVALAPILIILAKFILISLAIAIVIGVLYKFGGVIFEQMTMPLQFVLGLLDKIFPKLNALAGFRNFFGLDKAAAGAAKVEGSAGAAAVSDLTPQGATTAGAGAGLDAQSRMNPEFLSQTNNARVDINVRAPQSTTVQSEQANSGFVSINRGMMGAF